MRKAWKGLLLSMKLSLHSAAVAVPNKHIEYKLIPDFVTTRVLFSTLYRVFPLTVTLTLSAVMAPRVWPGSR